MERLVEKIMLRYFKPVILPALAVLVGIVSTWAVMNYRLDEYGRRIEAMEAMQATINRHMLQGDAELREKVDGRVDDRLHAQYKDMEHRLDRLDDRLLEGRERLSGVEKDACENTNEISSLWGRIDDAVYSKEPC